MFGYELLVFRFHIDIFVTLYSYIELLHSALWILFVQPEAIAEKTLVLAVFVQVVIKLILDI
jgi:hypothetical protein